MFKENNQHIEGAVAKVLQENSTEYQEYRTANYTRKRQILGLFTGLVFKKLSGRANLRTVKQVLNDHLGS